MAWFAAKEWKNRLVEFAGRRSLKNVSTNETTVYDVTRNEGQVSQEGDSFSATTMNDLEQRISDAFAEAEEANTQLISDLGGLSFGQDAEGNWGYKPSGADAVIPFKKIKSQTKTVSSGDNRAFRITFENLTEVVGIASISATNAFGVGAITNTINGGLSVSGNSVTLAVRADGPIANITLTAVGF